MGRKLSTTFCLSHDRYQHQAVGSPVHQRMTSRGRLLSFVVSETMLFNGKGEKGWRILLVFH
jgi:hypothetical protein